MANKPLNPQVRIHDGRPVVNRDWIVEHTGASRVTAALWYSKRNEVPAVETGADGTSEQVARHPEKAVTIARVDFYDQQQFKAFYAGLQDRKKKKLLPTDPELYDGDVEDRISINQAAAWFNFAGPGVIRKYLGGNPGYFPEAVGTVEGPTGRPIPAFRRADLQDFDRSAPATTPAPPDAPPDPNPVTASPRPNSASPPPSPNCATTATTAASPPHSRHGTTNRPGNGSAPSRKPATSTTAPTPPPLADEGQPRRRGHRPRLLARPEASRACSRAAPGHAPSRHTPVKHAPGRPRASPTKTPPSSPANCSSRSWPHSPARSP
ncbi:hypothetical protein [Actinacidiphila soli]|uniref:hypothetical protein n=1 Tax=Actinacidiphila soli TaxID=2487275 RepID=UPI000FCCCEBC|nr:hypothetical protein [Actinacidiphila soli]